MTVLENQEEYETRFAEEQAQRLAEEVFNQEFPELGTAMPQPRRGKGKGKGKASGSKGKGKAPSASETRGSSKKRNKHWKATTEQQETDEQEGQPLGNSDESTASSSNKSSPREDK